MNDEEVSKKLSEIIEHIDISPSSFAEEYGVNKGDINDIVLDRQVKIIVEALKKETPQFEYSTINVSRLLEKDKNEQHALYLIAATGDSDYIKNVVKDLDIKTSFKVDLAIYLGNKDFIKECLQMEKFTSSDKVRLLKELESEDIKEYLQNIRSDYVALYQKIELVMATHDSEYIQEFIEKNRNLLDVDAILKMILATEDEKYIDNYIRNDKIKQSSKVLLIKKVAQLTNNPQIIHGYVQELEKELDKEAKNTLKLIANGMEHKTENRGENASVTGKINLPADMTVGIEIESIGRYASALQGVKIGKWVGKKDASLNDYENVGYSGIEFVSSILCNNGQMENDIEKICSALQGAGQEIKDICGGHIHIGADYLTTTDSLVNFLHLLENSEDFLYVASNEDGEIPREMSMYYAEPFTLKLSKALINGKVNLDSRLELEKYIREVRKVQETDRYVGVNFYNLGRKRNTIEFRMPNGTLNAEQWIENINLFGGLVKAAEDIMIIENKDEKDRTLEEKKKLQLFYALPKLDNEERLNAILDLAIDGDKSSYILRYHKNRILIDNVYTNQSFDTQFVLQQGMIKPRDIGGLVFTGEDAVTTEELAKAEREIDRAMELDKGKAVEEL